MPFADRPSTFVVRQLQTWTENGWAVIVLPAGAIVTREGRLLMRLTKAEAERLAAELTDAARSGPTR